jgi:hypothetical protein
MRVNSAVMRTKLIFDNHSRIECHAFGMDTQVSRVRADKRLICTVGDGDFGVHKPATLRREPQQRQNLPIE